VWEGWLGWKYEKKKEKNNRKKINKKKRDPSLSSS